MHCALHTTIFIISNQKFNWKERTGQRQEEREKMEEDLIKFKCRSADRCILHRHQQTHTHTHTVRWIKIQFTFRPWHKMRKKQTNVLHRWVSMDETNDSKTEKRNTNMKTAALRKAFHFQYFVWRTNERWMDAGLGWARLCP